MEWLGHCDTGASEHQGIGGIRVDETCGEVGFCFGFECGFVFDWRRVF